MQATMQVGDKTSGRRLLSLGLLFLVSCTPPDRARGPVSHKITQVSVINALMTGRYEGVVPISELLREGDFGIGTLDHLDGELIVFEGRAYQARGDGRVAEVSADRSTPFAVITKFEKDGDLRCPPVKSLADLDAQLDKALPQKNNFVALRVDGLFDSLTIRSVRRQEPPYRPLAEVAKSQAVWTHKSLRGTLIGIRGPAWVAGLNVPGYHWHFLANDRKIGGHVLDCKIAAGEVQYEICRDWLVKLEGGKSFNQAQLDQDLNADLRRVESSRGDDGK